MGRKLDLTAINHWDRAIETHSANHPAARHLCESLDSIEPRKLIRGKLDILFASPECTHHSIARGGKPMSDQSRASAWQVTRWAEALLPRTIIVENVKEFQSWGPLDSKGRPLKSRAGETFQAWIQTLRSLGYAVEFNVLNSADFGACTARQRLFVIAKRGRGAITWPKPTHAKVRTQGGLFSAHLKPWRGAKEIIDWALPGTSIFSRKKDLAPATLARIEAGLRKFGGASAEPFLVILRNHQAGMSIHDPVPTITTSGAHVALCQPYITQFNGNRDRDLSRGIATDEPLPTVTAGGNRFGIVEPFIIPLNHGAKDFRSHSIHEPYPTITSVDAWAKVEPFLVHYYGTGDAASLSEPTATITTKDRFGLVQPMAYDIRFRMLQPMELAAAMGFPSTFKFSGTRGEVVKQIGNAVEVNQSFALALSQLSTGKQILEAA
jgi:DNA (cytosine-5)-methyltransferase 1